MNHRLTVLLSASVAVLMACVIAAGARAQIAIPGVIGNDNRRIVESLAAPWNAVGRVNVAGFKRRSLCTGTLVAPDKVITAAHCLFSAKTGRQAPLNTIHFVAGQRREDFVAHGRVKAVTFLPGFSFSRTATVAFLQTDVALLTLDAPLEIPPVPIAKIAPEKTIPLAHLQYARDRPFLPALDETCHLKAAQERLWATDCDTNFGGSGGPVFLRDGGVEKITAVMVGIASGRASFAVPASVWQPLLHGE